MTRKKYTFTEEEMEVSEFNIQDYLKTDEDMEGYLEACLAEGGSELFFYGLQDVIEAKGIELVARKTGLPREELQTAFEPGRHPQFDTVWKITNALGLNVSIGRDRAPVTKTKTKAKAASPKRRRKREAVLA